MESHNIHRILVADGDFTCRKAISQYLQEAGYAVSEAADGGTVMQMARKNGIALCIVDYHITGIACETILRTFLNDEDVPCIIITADQDEETERKARSLSPQFFFVKPLVLSDVKAVVDNILKGRTA